MTLLATTPNPKGRIRPKVAAIRLERIRIPDPLDVYPGTDAPPLAELNLSREIVDAVTYLHPPVLIPAHNERNTYFVIANVRIVQWRMLVATTHPHMGSTILSLVLPDVPPPAHSIAQFEAMARYLVPLVLGDLGYTASRIAQRALREEGLSVPRPITSRVKTQRLRNRKHKHHG